ncbi:hypothetical protein EDC65_0316 [Stella humosa]|uniref:Uncharacterized protein n=2 Tax=Stella humosa TaxID=94 RepID=A0A3N1MCX1_9PROT|nr:hypothetical protein EDC65_0316 [Stella humosa]BBK31513.1 hypothetical protein STHU_21470 [Stella humosa]
MENPGKRLQPAPDALRAALGQVIAEERQTWRRERQAIEAEARQTIAEMRAEFAEMRAKASVDIERREAEIEAMAVTVRELQRRLDDAGIEADTTAKTKPRVRVPAPAREARS